MFTALQRLAAPPAGQENAIVLGRPLLHEALWLGLCALMALRLSLAGRPDLALGVYALAAAPYVILIARGCAVARRPSSRGWQRIRLLYPFALMLLLYQATRYAIPALGLGMWDARLAAADRWLMGGDLLGWLDGRVGWIYIAPLAEIFSLAYLLLYVYLATAVARAARGPLRRQAAFSIGLWSTYAIGFLGYTLVPARGPYIAFAGSYQHPIDGWLFTALCRTIVDTGAAGYDVFPSLHVGATAFLLGWDWHTARGWFRIWALPIVLLWMSTLYLRYHYVVDVLAGAALASVALALAIHALRRGDDAGREEANERGRRHV
jgi:hypothetical protein